MYGNQLAVQEKVCLPAFLKFQNASGDMPRFIIF
jgi:hypothetical protein